MRDYPKGQLSKVDYENLLSMKEHSEQAKADLKKLASIDDSKIVVDRGTEKSPNIVEIVNPSPLWKQAGFKDKKELSDLAIAEIKPIDVEPSPMLKCDL